MMMMIFQTFFFFVLDKTGGKSKQAPTCTMVQIPGELAFCLLNIAALVSIIIYAKHHIHSDAYEVHTVGKHGED
jgi:hypothetical protein